MFRKIIAIILILLFMAGLAYVYMYIKQTKAPVSYSLNAVPGNAAIILQTRNASALWNKLGKTNIIWEEIRTTPYFNQLHERLVLLDSLMRKNSDVSEIISTNPLIVSFHKSGAENFDFLYLLNLPPVKNSSFVNDFISSSGGNVEGQSRRYEQEEIFSARFDGINTAFQYTLVQGIFIGSFSGMLIEDAIRQLHNGTPILREKTFAKVYETVGEKVDGNIFINYNAFAEVLFAITGDNGKQSLQPLSQFAGWSAIDLNLRPNILMLNGFTYNSDSLDYYLSQFKRQKPQQLEVLRLIPSNTSVLAVLGFSNYATFHKDYLSYQDRIKRKNNGNDIIKEYSARYEINIQKNLIDHIGSEMAVGVAELSQQQFEGKCFSLIKTNSIQDAIAGIDVLAAAINQKSNQKKFEEKYHDYTISQILLDAKFFDAVFGSLFSAINKPYYTAIGRYIVFANSIEQLKELVDRFGAERTLAKDANFKQFADNLSDESNVFVYSNIARSPELYTRYLNQTFSETVVQHTELLRKFEAVAFQFVAGNDMFFTNFSLKHNPVYKEERTTLWEFQLEADLAIKPKIVINHNDNTKEIFVQDTEHNIYLISNTGKKLWSKNIGATIMGEVQQVDALKNGRLQYLFNTSDKLYLIDRNGNDVIGFPIKLKDNATAPLTLLDYDYNKEYRIIIPCGDRIVNYKITGEPVQGWMFDKADASIVYSVQHVALSGKDYLITIDSNGKVYVFDRKGETRLVLKEKLKLPKNGTFYLEKGTELKSTFIVITDESGNVQKLGLTDELDIVSINEMSKEHFFDYKDIDNDKQYEYIFADEKFLRVYDRDKNKKIEYEFPGKVQNPIYYIKFPDNMGKIGVVLKEQQEIYLFKENGSLFEAMPLKGNSPFAISDINGDNQFDLIVGNGRNLFAYSLK
jgi:outer membrane protein assembly factor BamB